MPSTTLNATEPLVVEQVPIGNLRPDPFNPRRISDAELEALTRSLEQFGFVQPVVARREDRVVIGGHQRLVAARRLGYERVPVIWLEVTAEEGKLLGLALNRISGDWDQELLARLLFELQQAANVDLRLSGFGGDEIATYLRKLDAREKLARPERFDLAEALKRAQRRPVAQRGDLFVLGEHRLLCGDSTSTDDVARLLDGQEANLLATDPPYLVDYAGGEHPTSKGNRGRKTKDKTWDEYVDPQTSVDFYQRFLALGLAHCRDGVAVYQWHAHRRQALVEQAWLAAGLFVHQQLIWVKPRAVLTHSFFMWQHEPCLMGWKAGHQPKKRPPADQTTVWQVAGEQDGVHPTQKPVELFLRPIEYHTEPGDVVYEPFSGSGTQIIAAERLGRRCFAMEQEPQFVDVAVLRWELFTGEKTRKA